jgi:hypothetical protein
MPRLTVETCLRSLSNPSKGLEFKRPTEGMQVHYQSSVEGAIVGLRKLRLSLVPDKKYYVVVISESDFVLGQTMMDYIDETLLAWTSIPTSRIEPGHCNIEAFEAFREYDFNGSIRIMENERLSNHIRSNVKTKALKALNTCRSDMEASRFPDSFKKAQLVRYGTEMEKLTSVSI